MNFNISFTPEALIVAAVVGLVAGWIAHAILGGKGGLLRYIVLGLIGALIGPAILQVFSLQVDFGIALVNEIAVSTVGALVALLFARLFG